MNRHRPVVEIFQNRPSPLSGVTLSDSERKAAKEYVDRVMGQRAGDGAGPTEAAAGLATDLGIALTPRQVWNLWIDGDEE